MKFKLTILFTMVLSMAIYSQNKEIDQCWHVTDEKTMNFYDALFSNTTGSDPNLVLIKLDFIEDEMIYIVGVQTLREYCKDKYKIADSAVKDFTKQFIRNGTKIPLKDTILFKELDNQFNKYSFFPDSSLNKYRVLGIKNFMIKYCNGVRIKDSGVPVSIVAYFFENRIFWHNMTGNISSYALRQIENSCNINWDVKNNKWTDQNIMQTPAKAEIK